MKKIFIILFFIIFSSSFSLAKNNEKITVEDIEYVFFERYKNSQLSKKTLWKKTTIADIEQLKRHIKRQKYRGIAKCFYVSGTTIDDVNKCNAKVIRALLTKSEKRKKRRPGNIFYVLDAITDILPGSLPKNVRKVFKFSNDYKPEPGMKCFKAQSTSWDDGERQTLATFCMKYTKSFNKKLEKFKKDPSNEKVLGSSVVKYIKNIKIEDSIYEKIGTNNMRKHGPFWEAPRRGSAATAELTALERGERSIMELVPKTKFVVTTNYSLLGDMLNASVADIKKNNISPDLKIRRSLLKKYSLILLNIKEKLDEDNYKSIDKDVSKLSKIYKDLNALIATTNEMIINIDEAVNIIFDTNKLILKSALNAKESKEEKLLSLASINFMQSLITSILDTIPEKYFVETKELSQSLFTEYDLAKIEVIISTMVIKNKEIKSAELTKSMDIINKYINTSDVLKKLSNIGMKNSISRPFTIASAVDAANQQIRDSLSTELLRDAKKLLQNIDKNELSEITKEVSAVAKEASDVAKEVSDASGSGSVLDKKFGEVTLKQLIGLSRR